VSEFTVERAVARAVLSFIEKHCTVMQDGVSLKLLASDIRKIRRMHEDGTIKLHKLECAIHEMLCREGIKSYQQHISQGVRLTDTENPHALGYAAVHGALDLKDVRKIRTSEQSTLQGLKTEAKGLQKRITETLLYDSDEGADIPFRGSISRNHTLYSCTH